MHRPFSTHFRSFRPVFSPIKSPQARGYFDPTLHQSRHPPRLQDRVALITGSSSGLGRAISLAYASHGAKVVCADLRPDPRPGIEVEDVPTHDVVNIKYGPGTAVFVRTDVGESRDIESAVRESVTFGGRLDM